MTKFENLTREELESRLEMAEAELKAFRDRGDVGRGEGESPRMRSGGEFPPFPEAEDVSCPERNESGTAARVAGNFPEPVDSEKSEESLRFRSLTLDQIQDRVVVTDLEGRITYVNDASCRMLQKTREELIGRHVSILGEDASVGASQDEIVRGTSQDGKWRGEVVNIRADGSSVILDCRTHLVRDEAGRPIALCGISTDITEQKKAGEKLRQSEERFSKAFRTSPYAITITRARDGKLIEVNDAFYAISGYVRNEALGRSTVELNLWVDPENRNGVVSDLLVGKKVVGREYRFRRKNGETMMGLLSAQAILLENETCILSSINDITDYKRAQQERARLEQQFHQIQKLESVGRLAGGIAHDLNNLLSPILGYGELLLFDAGEDDRLREPLKEILKAAGSARDLVRQLLAFGRKQTLELRSVDLNDLVGNFENLLRRTIREDVAIQTFLAESLPPVRGDVGQLEQVLLNLAVNAQDAMPEGGVLTIETALVELDENYAEKHQGCASGAYAMLMVSDTGCGIDAEIREKIFEPFFTTKEKNQGTGLGLATVYGIVKQHGGNIWVYSEPDMGATFKVYIPVSERSPEALECRSEARTNLRGTETVLLVEDNNQVRRLALAILGRMGYGVIDASSGKEALDLLESHQGPLHLLLTDVVMPGMNGKQLYEKVSEAYPQVKALYMSGYTDNVIARRGIIDEGVRFIQKPFSINALAAKVREALDK